MDPLHENFSAIEIVAAPNGRAARKTATFRHALRLRFNDPYWQAGLDHKGTPYAGYKIDEALISRLTVTAEPKQDNLSVRDRIFRFYKLDRTEAYIQNIDTTAITDNEGNILEAYVVRVTAPKPLPMTHYWLIATDPTGVYAVVLATREKNWNTIGPLAKELYGSATVLNNHLGKTSLRLTDPHLTVPTKGYPWFAKKEETHLAAHYFHKAEAAFGVRLHPPIPSSGPLNEACRDAVFGADTGRKEVTHTQWPGCDRSRMIVAIGSALTDATPAQVDVTEMFRFFRYEGNLLCVSAWSASPNWNHVQPMAQAILNNITRLT